MRLLPILAAALLAAGCATSTTIESRRAERAAAYATLPPDERALVDQAQIRTGLGEDAVYIAWGKPAQVLRGGDAAGERTTWLYESSATDTYHYWRYREYPRRDGSTYIDRSLETDYNFHDYVSAELVFRNGRLESWRTLPKPPEQNYYVPTNRY